MSILVEDPNVRPFPPRDTAVGLDMGLDSLVTISTGEKGANLRPEVVDRRKLARMQKAFSRKQNGSNNRAKARQRVGRIYARIADRRRDYLHKLTTRLVRENQTVVIEDLSVTNMVRNRRLARAIYGASWAMMRSMLEYKCSWYGRSLVMVDRWFPSSKICSDCGALHATMPLGVRHWSCGCGATHDRDINAARNILSAGLVER